jgi:hypothetical protein
MMSISTSSPRAAEDHALLRQCARREQTKLTLNFFQLTLLFN